MVSRLPKFMQGDISAQPKRCGWHWTPALLGEGSTSFFHPPSPKSDLGNCCTGAAAPSSVHSALQLEKQTLELI